MKTLSMKHAQLVTVSAVDVLSQTRNLLSSLLCRPVLIAHESLILSSITARYMGTAPVSQGTTIAK
jgi:hypothetical protein